jgi:hypothetical protein
MTETQETRGGRIKDGRLVVENFHKGQDLSPFGHPYWQELLIQVEKVGLTTAHSSFILTLQSNASASRGKGVDSIITSLFQPPPQGTGTGTANWDPRLGTGPDGRTSTPLRTIDVPANASSVTLSTSRVRY